MDQIKPTRIIVAGILGGLAASLAVYVLFRLIGFEHWGILLDPEYQSPKLIKVWTEIEPIPLAVEGRSESKAHPACLRILESAFHHSVVKYNGKGLQIMSH